MRNHFARTENHCIYSIGSAQHIWIANCRSIACAEKKKIENIDFWHFLSTALDATATNETPNSALEIAQNGWKFFRIVVGGHKFEDICHVS